MGKKDTENAVYIAIISGAIGLLWDMLMNPCGKHWIPFFNSPSIDVACILKKGGLRLLPPIPPLGRRGGAGSSSKKDDDKKGRGDDDDDDDKGGGSTFGSGSGGSGKPPREDEPERTLDEILSGIRKESSKSEEISRRRNIERTRAYIRGKRAEGDDILDYLEDLVGGSSKVDDFEERRKQLAKDKATSISSGYEDDVNRLINDPLREAGKVVDDWVTGFQSWLNKQLGGTGEIVKDKYLPRLKLPGGGSIPFPNILRKETSIYPYYDDYY